MRARLIEAGLLYGGHVTARMNIHFALVLAPMLALFAWAAAHQDEVVVGTGEIMLNLVAVLGLPLLALAMPSR